MSTKNEDHTASDWQVRPVQTASIILAGVYLAGFLVLNAHLGKHGFYDFDLANSRHLIAGCLFVAFLAFWYLFAGRAIILFKKWIDEEIASAKKYGLSSFWYALIFINSWIKLGSFTCLSAALFSTIVLGSTESRSVLFYLLALFLIAYPWDILNFELRFPRANQVFKFVSNAGMILVFFITINNIVSPAVLVFFQFAVMSLYANLVLDSHERFKITTDSVTYDIIYSVVFVLIFSTSFGNFHYGNISSGLGGGRPQPVEIMIDEQTVWNGLKDMGFEVTPFLKAKLVHENQREFVIDLEGQTIRLPREAVAGFKMLPVEDGPWFLRYLN